MIEVELKESNPIRKPCFPKLMKHIDGTIVFFSDRSEGICIVGYGGTPTGMNQKIWDMTHFDDYNESITIKNKF